ncbi:MAG: hypothetical protein HKN10_02610 [Myxococcales bacterium]|nr:hypothetical protein [Deltaproteobacteria bacterium]NNE17347.1 hypothetical protein [Myxococcales bacterium]
MANRGRSRVLFIDAFVNFLLGVALLCFDPVAGWLGVPASDTTFYPTILGAVLFGIGIALVWEGIRGDGQLVGLGLGGAIAINLCGGVVLTAWLLFGDLSLPLRGQLILWGLAAILVLISLAELSMRAKHGPDGLR